MAHDAPTQLTGEFNLSVGPTRAYTQVRNAHINARLTKFTMGFIEEKRIFCLRAVKWAF